MDEKKPRYFLTPEGEFVIEHYNHAKPFANFFPGIAGIYGIPMWVFYVNRGQGISSCGTVDKNHAIMEFLPANKAFQMVSSHGFRTFIKTSCRGKPCFYEPFHNGCVNLDYKLINSMRISSHELTIEEKNISLDLLTTVTFFTIPGDSYAGLARLVTIKNLGRSEKKIQLADGLAQVVPYGTNNFFLKEMGRTIEAWMQVENLNKGVPFFRLTVDPTDKPEVVHITKGNFYLAFHYEKDKRLIVKPLVDPAVIFGPVTDFSYPCQFIEKNLTRSYPKELSRNKTPCAFSLLDITLPPGVDKQIFTLLGYMPTLGILNAALSRIACAEYITGKREQNKAIIETLKQDINTHSSSAAYDFYAQQTYLDNILRGGYPHRLPNKDIFYIYSRKHGDLERDYNSFHLEPNYFSQGNGNYRDANQNRRMDIWFHPDIAEENLLNFLSLLQTDGFNPLVVKGTRYILKDETSMRSSLKNVFKETGSIDEFLATLQKPYTPGDITAFVEEKKLAPGVRRDEFLRTVLEHSLKTYDAEHGEGFWTDHWHYNLDLIDAYLGVYPENADTLMFEKRLFTYYDNTEVVHHRAQKYMLHNGTVKQLHAIGLDHAKREMIRSRRDRQHVVRTQYGNGDIYTTTLCNKLLCLLANKLCSLDPEGIGIEMSANKPNWFDSLNGLPALFGSSTCETFEVKRLILMLRSFLQRTTRGQIPVTEEVSAVINALGESLRAYSEDTSGERDFLFWDRTHSIIEEYRDKTRMGVSGNEQTMSRQELLNFLDNALVKINGGIEKAKEPKKDIYRSYYIHEVTDYETMEPSGIKPKRFSRKPLPLFLEGQMHAVRLSASTEEARSLYKATKASALYDRALKMYKVTAPLASMPEEIGRCRVFTPGWLENESVWLHMEYKYLLELLKQGLYEEFSREFRDLLVPFQDPRRYGRSILENSSFIVSSAFPDESLHGNGFVARLSGSTAEFLQIWLMMNAGKNPFIINTKGELNLRFSPALPDWLFSRKDEYLFNFLSTVHITYHNPKRKNTFGKNAARIKRIGFTDKDGKSVVLNQETIPAPYAVQIRERLISSIDIELG